MLDKNATRHWFPIDHVLNYLERKIPEGARVLEIGPGLRPFSRVTHLMDLSFYADRIPQHLDPANVIIGNAEDGLPFEDKFFDYIYCRHVIEDLERPFHLLDEMSRVAKAGYIETPSVRAEICRGVDGQAAPWRGYAHHNWFVANRNGTLQLLRKFSLVEHVLHFDEEANESILANFPLYWNTYFEWEGKIDWEVTRPRIPSMEYLDAILQMANDGGTSAAAFSNLILEDIRHQPAA